MSSTRGKLSLEPGRPYASIPISLVQHMESVPPVPSLDKPAFPVVGFKCFFLPHEAMLGATDAQSQHCLWSGAWIQWPLMVPAHLGLCGKGQCHCPLGAVLDFSRMFWGCLWSLIPIGSADMWQLPPNTRPLEKCPE